MGSSPHLGQPVLRKKVVVKGATAQTSNAVKVVNSISHSIGCFCVFLPALFLLPFALNTHRRSPFLEKESFKVGCP